MNITVLGAGAWGTVLARLLHQQQDHVTLWGHHAEHLRDLERTGRNERYLAGVDLPSGLKFETDPVRATEGADCVVVAVPSKGFREVTSDLGQFDGMIISVKIGRAHV